MQNFKEGTLEDFLIRMYRGQIQHISWEDISNQFHCSLNHVRGIRNALSLCGCLIDEKGRPIQAFRGLDDVADRVRENLSSDDPVSNIELANYYNVSPSTIKRITRAYKIVFDWNKGKEVKEPYSEEEKPLSPLQRREVKELDTDTYINHIPMTAVQSVYYRTRSEDGKTLNTIRIDPKKAEAERALTTYDELKGIFDTYHPKVQTVKENHLCEVFCLSDIQLGKADETGGGSKETIERVLQSTDRFIRRVQKSHPEEIIITDLGDGIENINNTIQQIATNDMELAEQIRCYRRLLLEVIKRIAPQANCITFVSVPSNHGEIRNGARKAIGSPENDYGIEISYQLEDICKNSSIQTLENITFVRPAKKQYTCTVECKSGTVLAFSHGHKAGGGIAGQANWWEKQTFGHMPGWDAQFMVMGHFHSHQLMQLPGKRWLLSCASSEPSSDWFSATSGETSIRGVSTFAVDERATPINLEIL